jgi:hypothetical protein
MERYQPKILDSEFNAFVLKMAESIPYVLVDWDYASFEDMAADYESRGHICINTANSEGTIFGDPAINWAFRAWHDYAHIIENAPFDEVGERQAARQQCNHAWIDYYRGNITYAQYQRFSRIIDCEVNGQVQYYLKHNAFPPDQMAFAKEYLSCKN